MSRTKNRKKKKRQNLIRFIIIFITLFILLWFGKDIYYESNIKTKEESGKQESVPQILPQAEVTLRPKEDIQEEYKGYEVIARLEIPKIEVNTPVLANYSKQTLYECVTKFWGGEPNQIGNFCIAGHNSKRKNMFTDLKKLEIGDTLILSDEKIGIVDYEIYDIYKVKPENVECLSQNTNGNIDVTLITCTNDSAYRIIVKAKAKEG